MLAAAIGLCAALPLVSGSEAARRAKTVPCSSEVAEIRPLGQKTTYSPLPRATFISAPEFAFYARQTEPNHFDIGFFSSADVFRVQAQVEFVPENKRIVLRLAKDGCIVDGQGLHSSILALEHVYGLVLSTGVDAQFQVDNCDSKWSFVGRLAPEASQYAALGEIVRLRDEWLDARGGGGPYKRWIGLAIPDATIAGDKVSAKLDGKRGPIAGTTVAFAQRPHKGCFARTDTTGIARCTLEDYHGPDEHEHDEAEQRLTVTFTGGSSNGAVMLPISRTFPH